VPAGRAVATGTATGFGEFVNVDEVCPLHPLNHKLGNSVTTGYFCSSHPIVVDEIHEYFTAVPRVDRPGRVQHGHAEPGRQARAGMHQADVPVRERERHPGAHERAPARRKFHVFGGDEVGPRVAGMRIGRQRKIKVKPLHLDGQAVSQRVHSSRGHPARCADPGAPYPRSVAQTSRYTERLTAAWWLWLPAIGLLGLLGTEIYLLGPQLATWVPYLVFLPAATVGVWWAGRIRVAVRDDELFVDDAHLPLRYVAAATPLDAATKRDLLGPYAEPLAFVVQRPWIGPAVQVQLNDPDDPTPYWIVSTRHPEALAAAINSG
jgi:hypothetical protein